MRMWVNVTVGLWVSVGSDNYLLTVWDGLESTWSGSRVCAKTQVQGRRASPMCPSCVSSSNLSFLAFAMLPPLPRSVIGILEFYPVKQFLLLLIRGCSQSISHARVGSWTSDSCRLWNIFILMLHKYLKRHVSEVISLPSIQICSFSFLPSLQPGPQASGSPVDSQTTRGLLTLLP